MLRKCSNCGTEEDENKMVPLNTGRVQYLCWSCYKLGYGEAHMVDLGRAKRIERLQHVKGKKK